MSYSGHNFVGVVVVVAAAVALSTSLFSMREILVALLGQGTAAARAAIPICVCVAFSCVQTMVWLLVFGIRQERISQTITIKKDH